MTSVTFQTLTWKIHQIIKLFEVSLIGRSTSSMRYSLIQLVSEWQQQKNRRREKNEPKVREATLADGEELRRATKSEKEKKNRKCKTTEA